MDLRLALLLVPTLAACAAAPRGHVATPRERTAHLGSRADVSGPPAGADWEAEPFQPPKRQPESALELLRTERCPPEMALVGGHVCVDKWEGTLVERVGDKEIDVSPFGAIDGREKRMRAVSKRGVIPQGYISGLQAKQACEASGKRLCTSREWLKACRGPKETLFPYGDARESGTCNDGGRRIHPVWEAGKALVIPKQKLWREGMNEPLINQLEGTLLATGSLEGCKNEWGVYDMVGNLHEWVDDPAGTFQGGYFMDTTKNGDGCKYATTAHSFDYHDYSTGFRCCMDADRVE